MQKIESKMWRDKQSKQWPKTDCSAYVNRTAFSKVKYH